MRGRKRYGWSVLERDISGAEACAGAQVGRLFAHSCSSCRCKRTPAHGLAGNHSFCTCLRTVILSLLSILPPDWLYYVKRFWDMLPKLSNQKPKVAGKYLCR